MRIAYLLTGGALALAMPTLAQTPARTPTPQATPAATPTPDMSATPSNPNAMPMPGASATPATGVQQTTPSGMAGAEGAAPAGAAATGAPIPPTVGATVYGAAGTPVGTIKAMDSQFVTLTTAKGDVRLPANGVGPGVKGPVIGLTADQLDAAVTQAQATQPAPAKAATTTETKTKTKTTTRKPRR